MQQRTIIPSNNTHNLITHPIRDSSNIMSFYSSFSLLCLFNLALWFPLSTHAQNSPQDYLNAHNIARAQDGVAKLHGTTRWLPMLWTTSIRGKVIAIWCTQMDLTVRILPRDQVIHSQGLLQSTCGWMRSNTMTITPTHALVEANACTILRLCGATLFV